MDNTVNTPDDILVMADHSTEPDRLLHVDSSSDGGSLMLSCPTIDANSNNSAMENCTLLMNSSAHSHSLLSNNSSSDCASSQIMLSSTSRDNGQDLLGSSGSLPGSNRLMLSTSVHDSSRILLNGSNIAMSTLSNDDRHLTGDSMDGQTIPSLLLPENSVILDTPRGLFLSVGDAVNGVNNSALSTDREGKSLLPLPAALISQIGAGSQVAASCNGGILDQHPDSESITVCPTSLEAAAVCSGELQLPAGTVLSTTSPVEEQKKRRGGWPKGKRRKNVPEINAPRAPMTGYVLYAIARRHEIKDIDPNIPFAEVTKVLGHEWSAMSLDKKQKYLDEAEADKQRYVAELKAFQKSETYQNFQKLKKLKSGEDHSPCPVEVTESLIDLEDDTANELYCKVCNQYFSSVHNKKEHMFGRHHLQAITGEIEKEIQQHKEDQGIDETALLSTDLNNDASTSDCSEFNDSMKSGNPADITSFIHQFIKKSLERDQEIKLLKNIHKSNQEKNMNLCKQIQELKDYEVKLLQDISNLKSRGSAFSTQVLALKMVPTLFGVIKLSY